MYHLPSPHTHTKPKSNQKQNKNNQETQPGTFLAIHTFCSCPQVDAVGGRAAAGSSKQEGSKKTKQCSRKTFLEAALEVHEAERNPFSRTGHSCGRDAAGQRRWLRAREEGRPAGRLSEAGAHGWRAGQDAPQPSNRHRSLHQRSNALGLRLGRAFTGRTPEHTVCSSQTST